MAERGHLLSVQVSMYAVRCRGVPVIPFGAVAAPFLAILRWPGAARQRGTDHQKEDHGLQGPSEGDGAHAFLAKVTRPVGGSELRTASRRWPIFVAYTRMKVLFHIGRYMLLLRDTFSRPEKLTLYGKRTVEEMDLLGVQSLGIVSLLSVFMGAVITIQTKTNIESPLIQAWVVGFATRQSTILEFSPTIISLILAGKVGSNIAAEIGSMRVKEQIDALDIMGVNSAGYLILPKILGSMLFNPFLVMISMFLSIFGGYVAGVGTGIVQSADYLQGIQMGFNSYHVTYALIKTVVFAFIIATVSAYQGYYTVGGTREVGISSTRAVVYSNVVILIVNYALTQLLLI